VVARKHRIAGARGQLQRVEGMINRYCVYVSYLLGRLAGGEDLEVIQRASHNGYTWIGAWDQSSCSFAAGVYDFHNGAPWTAHDECTETIRHGSD
jgi:hypothetical protein